MSEIYYLNRRTKKIEKERVYGQFFIELFYGNGRHKFFFTPLLQIICRLPLFSRFYGWLQKRSWSKRKILPFIKKYQIDASEFLEDPSSFSSFNDFFIRRLSPSARPISEGDKVAALPADGRYLAFSRFPEHEGIFVKGECFSLEELLGDHGLATKYTEGPLVIARLCPVDYHRFHFPCDCVPSRPKLIRGPLYSVNPQALKKNIHYLSKNKRVITSLKTSFFGEILYIEVGATYVGSIQQTFSADEICKKGQEKGYFAFGGSCLLLCFEKGSISLESDLVEATKSRMETLSQMGQKLGISTS